MSGRALTEKGYPYDNEVDWIGTNGNVYIPTDFIPNTSDLTFTGKFYFGGYTDSTQWAAWWSAYTNEQASTYRVIRSSNSNTQVRLYNGVRAGGGGTTVSASVGDVCEFTFTPTQYVWNGTTYSHGSDGSVNTGVLQIFSQKFIGRMIGHFRIYKGNTLIRDYMPVVKNGVGYIYENISGRLYANIGTGTVLYGSLEGE